MQNSLLLCQPLSVMVPVNLGTRGSPSCAPLGTGPVPPMACLGLATSTPPQTSSTLLPSRSPLEPGGGVKVGGGSQPSPFPGSQGWDESPSYLELTITWERDKV